MINDFKSKNEFSTFNSLLKKELILALKQKFLYFSAIIFVIFVAFIHFISQNFYSMDIGTTNLSKFFLSMPYICILLIPTLIMNLWTNKNDIFDTLPVSSTNKIISKFFAALVLFIVILFFSFPIVLLTNFFGDISFSAVFTGYFVIVLYGSCVISLCLFCFSLVQNKALAFFSSSLILALINSLHFLPLYLNLPKTLANISRLLSVSWHFDAASKGILDTRDCVFYLTLTFLFCILTIFVVESKKKGKVFNEVFFYPIIACLLILNGNLYYARLDLTASKQFSLAKETKDTLDSLIKPLEITYYLSDDLENIYPQVRDVKDFLYQLSYENDLISVKILDPKKKGLEKSLYSLGIVSQQIQTTEENKTSFSQVYSSIMLEYGGKYKTLPFVLSTSELEYGLLTRIKSLARNFKMEALILVGNGLSLEKEYSYVTPWFESAGFIVSEISASELETLEISPNQCLIVLGSSKLTLNNTVAIETFLHKGGKALFAVTPNTVDITSSWTAKSEGYDPLLDMLSSWGLSVGNGIIQDLSNYRIRMYATTSTNQIDYNNSIYVNYPFWIVTLPQNYNKESLQTASLASFESFWASPITVKQIGEGQYIPLIFTSQFAWLQEPYSISKDIAFVTDPLSSTNTKPSNVENGQYLLAATFEGNLPPYYLTSGIKNTTITVISDQYFPSITIENTNSPNNLNFLITNALYLSGNKDLIKIKNKGYINSSLYKISDSNQFKNQMIKTNIVVFGVVPFIILSLYIFQIFLRKRSIKKIYESFLLGEKGEKNE